MSHEAAHIPPRLLLLARSRRLSVGQRVRGPSVVARVNKYHARKVTIDGITFASGLEGRRYRMLKIMERAGEITDLRLQVVYDLNVNGIKIGRYIADFVYIVWHTGEEIIEDAKGKLTEIFKRSAKHMAAQGNPVTIWPPRQIKTRKRRVKV